MPCCCNSDVGLCRCLNADITPPSTCKVTLTTTFYANTVLDICVADKNTLYSILNASYAGPLIADGLTANNNRVVVYGPANQTIWSNVGFEWFTYLYCDRPDIGYRIGQSGRDTGGCPDNSWRRNINWGINTFIGSAPAQTILSGQFLREFCPGGSRYFSAKLTYPTLYWRSQETPPYLVGNGEALFEYF